MHTWRCVVWVGSPNCFVLYQLRNWLNRSENPPHHHLSPEKATVKEEGHTYRFFFLTTQNRVLSAVLFPWMIECMYGEKEKRSRRERHRKCWCGWWWPTRSATVGRSIRGEQGSTERERNPSFFTSDSIRSDGDALTRRLLLLVAWETVYAQHLLRRRNVIHFLTPTSRNIL